MPAALAVLLPAAAKAAIPLNYLTSAGRRADVTLPLTWGVLGISIAVVLIMSAVLFWAILRRRGGPADFSQPLPVERSGQGLRWVAIGVILTTVVLFLTVIWTIRTLAVILYPHAPPALTVRVTAHEWWWEVTYLADTPSESFSTANEIHIPVGEPVRLELIGDDVIHSFWVPALSGKTDVIPGQTNMTWIAARRPGTYRGQCTEYCGAQHANMAFLVVADPPAAFARWRSHEMAAETPPDTAEEEGGERNFIARCGACHSVRGSGAGGRLGPDLTHLASRNTLAAGILKNTRANLEHWIERAQEVKPGSKMPDIDLDPAELKRIADYLETLG